MILQAEVADLRWEDLKVFKEVQTKNFNAYLGSDKTGSTWIKDTKKKILGLIMDHKDCIWRVI